VKNENNESIYNENTSPAVVYGRALEAMEQGTTESYHRAAELFISIPQYKDAAELAANCLKYAEQARKKSEKARNKKLIIACVILLIAAAVVLAILLIKNFAPTEENNTESSNDTKETIETTTTEEHYTTAPTEEKAENNMDAVLEEKYNTAVTLKNNGENAKAAIAFGSLGDYKDAKSQSRALWDIIAVRDTISAGQEHVVGLKNDGTVIATGRSSYGSCDVEDWDNIVAVSAGRFHTVGLKEDGTVVAVGNGFDGQCDSGEWNDIVAIDAGSGYTVGLKADGTVVAVGNNYYGQCDVGWWKNIIAISAGEKHTLGLRVDGTVVATGNDLADVYTWGKVVAISMGSDAYAGLRSDGTVVSNYTADWGNIKAISTGTEIVVCLRYDGRVNITGHDIEVFEKPNKTEFEEILIKYSKEWYDHLCMVRSWTDIVAITAYENNIYGLRSDGSVISNGNNGGEEFNVRDWVNIKTP